MLRLNFQLMNIFHWSLTEIENMIPWEREVYVSLLTQHLENENKQLEEQMKNL